MDIQMLVSSAQKGNKDALVELLEARKNDYYRLAYTYMQNREDAMDAIQEMSIVVYRQIGGLRKPDSFYSWSNTILVNCCRSILRKEKPLLLGDEPQKSDAFEKIPDALESKMDLEEGLAKLKAHYQEVIKLRYYLDMDYETMAKLLNVPTGTVKSRVHNGLKKLKGFMEGRGSDERGEAVE